MKQHILVLLLPINLLSPFHLFTMEQKNKENHNPREYISFVESIMTGHLTMQEDAIQREGFLFLDYENQEKPYFLSTKEALHKLFNEFEHFIIKEKGSDTLSEKIIKKLQDNKNALLSEEELKHIQQCRFLWFIGNQDLHHNTKKIVLEKTIQILKNDIAGEKALYNVLGSDHHRGKMAINMLDDLQNQLRERTDEYETIKTEINTLIINREAFKLALMTGNCTSIETKAKRKLHISFEPLTHYIYKLTEAGAIPPTGPTDDLFEKFKNLKLLNEEKFTGCHVQ